MTITTIFATSGIAIIILILLKKWGERRRRALFILRLISKGDMRIRGLYHRAVHSYTREKERALHLLKRRIPMRSRNSLNKLTSFVNEKRGRYIESLRDSKLLNRPEGISEFFKSMSETERGNGEIHDRLENGSQNNQEEVE